MDEKKPMTAACLPGRRAWMKRLYFCILAVLLCLTGCRAPDFQTERAKFMQAWDAALPVGQILKKARENYQAKYPDDLNLSDHPDLLTADDFTGPIICFGDPLYIPDMEKRAFTEKNVLPEGLKAKVFQSTARAFELRDDGGAFFSNEKLKALKKHEIPVVYMVVECTGYAGAGTPYRKGTQTVLVQTLTWRISFYSFDTGQLLAWEDQPRHYEMNVKLEENKGFTTDQNGRYVFAGLLRAAGPADPAFDLLAP